MVLPTKQIVSRAHLQAFLESETYRDIVGFVTELNDSVVGKTLRDDVQISEPVQHILDILQLVDGVIDAHPPVDNGKSRFGNPAFRDVYDGILEGAQEWHRTAFSSLADDTRTEIAVYFAESWGNRLRIDYGSGMELNFICWLLCLKKLDVLTAADDAAVVLKIFWKYLLLCRRLQSEYWLEPAGSHGAQGLDDYHFAVFIFGAAQLKNHKYLRPKSIHDPEILDDFAKDYMYFDYVRYINSIKTASLRWHSPMLDDISGVKTWAKVDEGMLKMYKAEVLAKLPVAQHILFGSLLPFNADAVKEEATPQDAVSHTAHAIPDKVKHLYVNQSGTDDDVHMDHDGHLHVRGEGFEDCCGIPIPSAYAAAQERQKKQQDLNPLGYLGSSARPSVVRRVPFD